MNVVNRYIPNEVGTYNTGSTGGLYYGGGNIKAGLIKNFILESIPNAIVLSNSNPPIYFPSIPHSWLSVRCMQLRHILSVLSV